MWSIAQKENTTPSVWRGRILANLFVCLMFEKSCCIHNCLNRPVIVKIFANWSFGLECALVYLFDSTLTIRTCFAPLKPLTSLRPEKPCTYIWYMYNYVTYSWRWKDFKRNMKDFWTNSKLPDLHRERFFVGESGSVFWATLWACQSDLGTRGSIFEHIWRWFLARRVNVWER